MAIRPPSGDASTMVRRCRSGCSHSVASSGWPLSDSHSTSLRPLGRSLPSRKRVSAPSLARQRVRNARQRLDMRLQIEVAALPVEPGHLVVLRIGVVVAVLGAAELVAGRQHDRCRARQTASTAARGGRAVRRVDDRGIGGVALDAVVPRQVLVVAVAVVLAIGLVVLALVAGRGRPASTRHGRR